MQLRILFRSLVILVSLQLGLVPVTWAAPKGDKIAEIDGGRYESFELTNGLKVLLIRNENTSISGAAISIAGGQMSTPEQLQGLPHLLEHIVFLGSDKYPGTSDWHEFISRHTGWSNGSTLSDLTRFQFQLQNDGLKEGLSRLSTMLFQPRINDETIEIGLSEVNKEFTSKKDNDWQGILSVLRAMANPSHPGSKFGLGNGESLQASPGQLKAALESYQTKYYVPWNMTLAVYTQTELTEMRQFIESTFGQRKPPSSQIAYSQNNMRPAANMNQLKASAIPLFNQKNLGSLIAVQTHSPDQTLDLRFELPPARDHQTYALYQLISELIGHETKGSIIARLRKLGLATALNTVFQGDGRNEVFDIYIRLTDRGSRSLDTVIGVAFSYINLLSTQELPSYVQEERAQVLTRNRLQVGTQEVGDWLGELSNDMLRMPTTNWLQYRYETVNVSQSDITETLSTWITPKAMQAVFSSPRVTGEQKTPYFDTPYSLRKFTDSQLKNWQASQKSDSLHFPAQNPYLNIESETQMIESVMPFGQLTPQIHLVEVKDSLDATVVVNLTTHNLTLSAKTATPFYLAQKFILMSRFETALADRQYFASLVGYSVRTEDTQEGVRLTFTGRREGIAKYMADVIQASLTQPISQAEFKAITDHALSRLKTYFNAKHFNKASFDTELKIRGYGDSNADEIIKSLKKMRDDEGARPLFTTQIIADAQANAVFQIFYAGDLVYFKVNAPFKNWGQNKVEPAQKKSLTNSPEIDPAATAYVPLAYNLSTPNVVSWRLATRRKGLAELAATLVDRELWETKFKTYMRQEKRIAYHAGVRVSRSIHRPSLDFIIESNGHRSGEALTSVYTEFFQSTVASLTEKDLTIAKQQAIQRLRLKGETPQGALNLLQASQHYFASDNLSEFLTALNKQINADNLDAVRHRQALRQPR
ncbi:insulinase family protein [Shewanella sp. KCT]|uniref:insulinase family protein n=1 Tax=Shewanella sp. KCT TaxID=2569535 RepID=UPI001182E136|nr:insulinase family protein [Shewanella sp. KCT]TVP10858.1 hypothetical protein AYI87_17195 [Shewanella sp. KCT]